MRATGEESIRSSFASPRDARPPYLRLGAARVTNTRCARPQRDLGSGHGVLGSIPGDDGTRPEARREGRVETALY